MKPRFIYFITALILVLACPANSELPVDLAPIGPLIVKLEAKNNPLAAAIESIQATNSSPAIRMTMLQNTLDAIHANYRQFKSDVISQVGKDKGDALIASYENWLRESIKSLTNSSISQPELPAVIPSPMHRLPDL